MLRTSIRDQARDPPQLFNTTVVTNIEGEIKITPIRDVLYALKPDQQETCTSDPLVTTIVRGAEELALGLRTLENLRAEVTAIRKGALVAG